MNLWRPRWSTKPSGRRSAYAATLSRSALDIRRRIAQSGAVGHGPPLRSLQAQRLGPIFETDLDALGEMLDANVSTSLPGLRETQG